LSKFTIGLFIKVRIGFHTENKEQIRDIPHVIRNSCHGKKRGIGRLVYKEFWIYIVHPRKLPIQAPSTAEVNTIIKDS